MIVVVDERATVTEGYASWFDREGVSACGLAPGEFESWVSAVSDADMRSVEAVLLGDCGNRAGLAKIIRRRSAVAAIIVMNEHRSLEETLELFAAGVDDVVRKPIHVREIIARVKAIRRRASGQPDYTDVGEMRVFFDGRDPEVKGEVLQLPRRERRILEYLVANRGCRINKTQIFNSVYGLFSEDIDENVVESHISKLRKRLRHRLGYDPIDSKRYLGYRLVVDAAPERALDDEAPSSLTQDANGLLAGVEHFAKDPVV
ncbi:response regulator transcription factor [Hyphomicrobium sp. CS1GBMeth3]|uniref:response regulator transcription factor n=1 Tax=Hyphomicrobium sp. CS1GBMeth3 TaxID=1892845 RepID=UPI0009306FF8|nr:response regulator transcription factor [Hyphomicrobium sp. CS1GBMeth3]